MVADIGQTKNSSREIPNFFVGWHIDLRTCVCTLIFYHVFEKVELTVVRLFV